MWSLGWVADYPGPNDFLGVLLGTISRTTTATGAPGVRRRDRRRGAATDPAAILAAYERAETIVQRDAPAIPLSNGSGWALARKGLLGASDNGLGLLRPGGPGVGALSVAAARAVLVACATRRSSLASLGVPLVAAADVTFGTPTASSVFGKSLSFSQPVR